MSANKLYCLSCNRATDYEYQKPKFCSHCGKSYINIDEIPSNAKISSPPPLPRTRLKPRHIEDVEDNLSDEDINDITKEIENVDISKIGIELPRNMSRSNRQDIAQLVSTGSPRQPRKRGPVGKISKKDAIENWTKTFPKNSRESTEI